MNIHIIPPDPSGTGREAAEGRPLHFKPPPLDTRTIVYVDGFNLYYGCLRGTPYRWLDLNALCRALLPKNDIVAIKYFTAKVAARPGDPDQPNRQMTYLRALRTIPHLEIHLGHFLSHVVSMPQPIPRGAPRDAKPTYVQVVKTEEKGSDVNLATHLLVDAFGNQFDVAAIITNDSDLAEPVRVVSSRLKKSVGIICPREQVSATLRGCATFIKKIRRGALRTSQFPLEVKDRGGSFRKPAMW